MNVEIVKFDNLGRGIGYINNKIIFIPKTVPGDIVRVKIVEEKTKYIEGKILEIVKPSKIRKNPLCPYFNICGGCDLQNVSISETLEYKLNKVNDILQKNKIDFHVDEIIKSDNYINYRNKISLKVVNKEIGFYEDNTHNLIKIDNCLISKEEINRLLNDLKVLNIINGNITIRCNYHNELLIIIETKDKIDNISYITDNYKIAGIILNNKCIYGEDYFIDKIDNYLFRVSYNSFFQINPYITSKLFELIKRYSNNSVKILDFYCGTGTLGMVASEHAKKVLGVEIVESAVNDAKLNAKLNNKGNLEFVCSDTKKVLDKITNEYDTIIFDPPRSGVSKEVLEKTINENISKIIYISCNPQTLVRDLKYLEDYYKIEDIKLLDMFPYTEHIESICILKSCD